MYFARRLSKGRGRTLSSEITFKVTGGRANYAWGAWYYSKRKEEWVGKSNSGVKSRGKHTETIKVTIKSNENAGKTDILVAVYGWTGKEWKVLDAIRDQLGLEVT